jgi:hypothetical protein
MAKRKIYLGPINSGLNGPLLGSPGLVIDAFTAGELLVRTATGYATASAAATVFGAECLIAQEISESEGGLITTPYTVGDSVEPLIVRSGEFVNASVAASQNITRKGTPLSSNGDGTLKIAVTPGTVGATSEQVLFYSEEIVNTGGAVALVTVRKA